MNNVVLSTKNIDDLVSEIANEVVRKIGNLNAFKSLNEIDPNERLNARQAAQFLDISLTTLYSKNSLGELPSYKAPGSKKIFFFKKDLLEFLKEGKKKSIEDFKKETSSYLVKRKGGKKC